MKSYYASVSVFVFYFQHHQTNIFRCQRYRCFESAIIGNNEWMCYVLTVNDGDLFHIIYQPERENFYVEHFSTIL